MTAAYQAGFEFAKTVRETFSKNCRKDALRAAGIEVTNVTAEEFAAGHAAGVAELEAERAPEEARIAAIAAKNEALCDAVTRDLKSNRGEEMYQASERLRREHMGMVEAPAHILAMIGK